MVWATRAIDLAEPPRPVVVRRVVVRADVVDDDPGSLVLGVDEAAVPQVDADVGQAAAKRVLEEDQIRSEEHTSELQSRQYLVCRLLLEKKKTLQLIHSHSHI